MVGSGSSLEQRPERSGRNLSTREHCKVYIPDFGSYLSQKLHVHIGRVYAGVHFLPVSTLHFTTLKMGASPGLARTSGTAASTREQLKRCAAIEVSQALSGWRFATSSSWTWCRRAKHALDSWSSCGVRGEPEKVAQAGWSTRACHFQLEVLLLRQGLKQAAKTFAAQPARGLPGMATCSSGTLRIQ